MKKGVILVIVVLFCMSFVSAYDVYLFFTPGCPQCAYMINEMTRLEKENPDMKLNMLNLKYIDNMLLFKQIRNNYGFQDYKAPVLFVGNKVYTGYNDKMGREIEDYVEDCSKDGCVDPKEKVYDPDAEKESQTKIFISLFLVIFLVCLAVGFFVKKQWENMNKDIKKPTTRFMD